MIKTIRVDVTQADISNGIRLECTTCPVALAINRLLKPSFQASVKSGYTIIRRRGIGNYNDSDVVGYRGDYKLVSRFIRQFDIRGYVEPFSFELTMDVKYLA